MGEMITNDAANAAALQTKVEDTINELLTERKLKWMSTTMEFREGLLVGLELAGMYGDEIHKLYSNKRD